MKRSKKMHSFADALLLVLIACRWTFAVSCSAETVGVEQKPQSKIVFYKGNIGAPGIRVINPDGTGFAQLTHEKFDMFPHWSPDGSQIAFLTKHDVDYEMLAKYRLCMHWALYTMDGEGGGQKRIADVPVMIFYWSTDSQHIAFISGYENSENFGKDGIDGAAVYVVDTHNGRMIRLTDADANISPRLSWSPLGQQIAYSTRTATRKYDIFTVHADGSKPQRIAAGDDPVWSPDGKQILFLFRDGELLTSATGIQLADADGSNQRQVSTESGYVRLIGFSPDGTKILYQSNNDLCVMDTDGSNRVNLSKGMFKAIDMSQFIENGTKVFFAGRNDKDWELFSVCIDGVDLKTLTGNPRDDLPNITNDATK